MQWRCRGGCKGGSYEGVIWEERDREVGLSWQEERYCGVSYRLRWKLGGWRLAGLRLNFLGVGCYQEKL